MYIYIYIYVSSISCGITIISMSSIKYSKHSGGTICLRLLV